MKYTFGQVHGEGREPFARFSQFGLVRAFVEMCWELYQCAELLFEMLKLSQFTTVDILDNLTN